MLFDIIVYFSLGLAVIGGMIFAQWPRPGLVFTYRITGACLGVMGILGALIGAFLLRSQSPVPDRMNIILIIIPALPAMLWLLLAIITDSLYGQRILGSHYKLWSGELKRRN